MNHNQTMSWWVRNLNIPSQVRNSEAIINLTVKKDPTTTTGMPNLPEEIINDVLLRLPVKSLLKFKCVSKSWRSLISDPHFIKNHLHMSATNDNYANHRLLLTNYDQPYYFKSFSLHTFFNEPYLDSIIEFPHPYPRNLSRMVGSCNGLFCSTITININDDKERIFLWNPSTRESRWLPGPGFKSTTSSSVLLYGLGYDCSIDDYKLVVIRNTYHNGSYFIGEMKVYTLRTNSWRDIQPYPSGLPELSSPHASGIFLGGALIWHVPVYPREILKIPAFDLAMETFQELSTPVIENGDAWNIGVLGECLCFIVSYTYVNVDVWVMKEYGVSESWTKLVTVPYVGDILSSKSAYYHPIWLLKNGEILLKFKSLWVVYDPKKYTIKFEENNNGFIDPMSCGPCVYIESLVSPNPMPRITDFGKKKKRSTTRYQKVDPTFVQ